MELLGRAWEDTPGATEWVRDFRRDVKQTRQKSRKGKKPPRR
jgi:hypothetical protein